VVVLHSPIAQIWSRQLLDMSWHLSVLGKFPSRWLVDSYSTLESFL